MEKKTKPQAKRPAPVMTAKTKVKDGKEYGSILSAEQKKQLVKEKLKERKAKKVPRTAQQTIPYQEMFRDGICRVNDHYYTKCVQFFDINYQLAQNEDKTAAFEFWCDFYNYFDSSIRLQLSCMSQYANVSELVETIDIPAQKDEFDGIREEYATMLKEQLAKGNNGLMRSK